MPRAIDVRQIQPTHDPNRSGTEFHMQGLIKTEAEILVELLAQLGSSFTDTIIDIIQELTGIDLSALGPLLEEMELDFSTPEAFLLSLVHAIEVLPEVLVTLVTTIITELVSGGMMLLDLGQALLNAGAGLLGIQSPLNAANLFGTLLPGLFSNVPIGALNNTQPNLLTAGTFPAASSIVANPIWSWDSTVTRTSGTGAAKVTADGSLKGLRSNKIQVAQGRPLDLSVWVKWDSLTFTGAPLQLHVVVFDEAGAQDGSPIVIDTHTPAGGTGGWVELSGVYDPAPGVSQFCQRLVVTGTATAGTVWFDDGSVKQTGQILQDWVQNLVTDLQSLLHWIENLVDQLLDALGLDALGGLADKIFDLADEVTSWFGDTETAIADLFDLNGNLGDLIDRIFEGLQGGVPVLGGLDELIDAVRDALGSIPFFNILGIGGPGNIGDSIQATWDQWVSGLVGFLGSGSGLADLFNIGQDVSSRATRGAWSWDILGIRSNKSLNTGLLPTSESNIGLDKVALQSSAPTFSVTQSTAITAFQRISEAASKGVVSWLGSGVTNITHAFVNIYRMDPTTGDMTLVHQSANIVGDLSATMQYNIYRLPTALAVEPGEVYGIEVAIRGAGTHSVVGSSTWLPDHPGVYPRRLSAVRNSGTSAPPSTIASGSVSYTSNVPFIEFAVSAGEVAIPRTPLTTLFNTPGGPTTLPVPTWANYVEVITLGGGGGGRQGAGLGISGEGGDNGAWATGTWSRGTHFTGAPSISVMVAAGGIGDIGIGGNGGTSSASIPGYSVSSTGGEGGDALGVIGSDSAGQSPGNRTYGSPPVTYVGGGTQNSFGGPGAAPGGGGAGGDFLLFQAGGDGAAGAVWIRFRQ